jgi:hypothetical protein
MSTQRYFVTVFTLFVAAVVCALWLRDAQAVPSFARQTERTFKLTGYTMSKRGKKYQFPPPLSGLAQFSFTHTNKEFPPGTAPFNSQANDNLGVPQELATYYAGKIYDKLGTFMHGAYDGLEEKFVMDITDIRLANTGKIKGKPLIYGLTINNNPTVQDVWNSTPAFSFPYATSSIAPTPAASTVIDNTLAQQLGGIGIYAYFKNLIYGEVTFYRTLNGYPV